MNAPTTFPPIPVEHDGFSIATSSVNAWRGRCVTWFARAEAAATDLLLRLAQQGSDTPRHFYVQRLMALECALQTHVEGAKATAALRRFREHDRLRTFITHGHGKVTLDRADRWQLVLTVTDLRSSVSRTVLVIDQDESELITRRLHGDCQRLEHAFASITPPERPCDLALRMG